MQIGTPPRDFQIIMDSGSADFWVGGENCQTAQQAGTGARTGTGAAAAASSCGNHVFLGSHSSSSFVDTQTPFNVTYGSGAVAGTIINDNVAIAGLALNNHTFGTAQQETVQFTGVQCLSQRFK